jgi:hypothetical protein
MHPEWGGDPTYWLEVDEEGDARREIVEYPDGHVLSYDPSHPRDRYGALSVMSSTGMRPPGPASRSRGRTSSGGGASTSRPTESGRSTRPESRPAHRLEGHARRAGHRVEPRTPDLTQRRRGRAKTAKVASIGESASAPHRELERGSRPDEDDGRSRALGSSRPIEVLVSSLCVLCVRPLRPLRETSRPEGALRPSLSCRVTALSG